MQTRYSAPRGEVKAKRGSCPVGCALAAGEAMRMLPREMRSPQDGSYSFFRNSSA